MCISEFLVESGAFEPIYGATQWVLGALPDEDELTRRDDEPASGAGDLRVSRGSYAAIARHGDASRVAA